MTSALVRHAPVNIKLDYVTFKIDVVNEQAKAVASEVYEERVGLSLRELRLMRFIATQPGLTVSRLIELAHVEKTLTSKSIAALVRRNLILRKIDPNDARQTNLYLTAEGTQRVQAADQVGQQMESNMLSILSDTEAAMFKQCLEKLYLHYQDKQIVTDTFLKPVAQDLPCKTAD